MDVGEGGLPVWSNSKILWMGAGESGTVPKGMSDKSTDDCLFRFSDVGTGTGEEW
jgi:hypothetical protein